MCVNRSTQRLYILHEEATGPTAASEAIITTGVIDMKQKKDVMTLDIPNPLVQTEIALDRDTIIMKIRGNLVDILLKNVPGVYNKYVQYKGGQNILYIRVLKLLYGIFVSLIMYYNKFRKDIEVIAFEVNLYDICVANPMKYGKQQTMT